MKKKLSELFSGHGFKCLTAVCCFFLLFGSVLLTTQQEAATVYAEQGGVTDFVSRLYEYVLEREADENGLATWTDALQSGDFTGTEVAKGFIMSDEFLGKDMSNEEFVQILYRAFFGREADAAGLETWVNFLDQGYRKSYVFAGFANSGEFNSLCDSYEVRGGSVPVTISEQQPNLSDEEYNTWLFVERLYTEVLGRTPDVAGLGEWAGYLQDGTFSGAEVAKGFILSTEFEGKDVSNEEYVQIMYKTFFGREADPAGLETWVSALETQYDKRYVFAGFANSTEFGNLCDSYEIEQGEVSALEVVPEAPYMIINKDKSVCLRWNAVEGMSQYGVWRSERNAAGEIGEYVWLGNTDQLEYYDTNVVNGTTYYYKITAFDTEMMVHSEKSEAIEWTHWYVDYSLLFKWTENADGTLTLTEYLGQDTILYVPWAIDGKTVTAIGKSCFGYNDFLENVVLMNNITTIGVGAFQGCYNLKEIRLSESLVEIAPSAFDKCDSLVTLHIPAGVKSFYVNRWTEEDTDGTLVEKTEQKKLYGCFNLTSITVDEENTAYADVDGVLYNKDKTQIVCVPTEYQGVLTIADTVTYMETNNIFEYCSGITEIVIPKDMEHFDCGLYGCLNLEKFTIAEGNKYYAAEGATLFSADKKTLYYVANGTAGTSYAIPEGVETVAEAAFESCMDVEEITIPASVKELGVTSGDDEGNKYCNIFANCNNLKTLVADEANEYYQSIDGVLFSKDGTAVVAYPRMMEGESYQVPEGVTDIGQKAFMYCRQLMTVSLPSSVKTIQPWAFQSCYELMEIDLPESLNYLGERAFAYCESLQTVRIPEGITEIPKNAFMKCSMLMEVELPASLETIDNSAFSGCGTLDIVYAPKDSYAAQWAADAGYTVVETDGEAYPDTSDWFNWIEWSDGNIAINGINYENFQPMEVIRIPAEINGRPVTAINSLASSGKDCETLIIPEGVTEIAMYALQNCGYTSIRIPSTLREIGSNAFANNSNLTKFTVHAYNPYFASVDGILYSRDLFTLYCVPVNSATTKFVVPETVEMIQEGAFHSCITLEEIIIPARTNYIAYDAFANCTNLAKITVDEKNEFYNSFDSYVLSEDGTFLEFVANAATELEIPASVRGVDSMRLQYATSLTNITVEEGNERYCAVDGVLFESDMRRLVVYPDKKEGTSYVVPESVTVIIEHAFDYCRNLVSIELPENLEDMGMYAFQNCSALTSMELPDGVTNIPMSAFLGCTALEEVTFPKELTYIQGMAFMSCTSLKNVVIPDGVTTIEFMVFAGCANLETVDVPMSVINMGTNIFDKWGMGDAVTIRTPEGSCAAEYAENNKLGLELVQPENSPTASWFNWVELADGTVAISGINYANFQNVEELEVPARINGKQVSTLLSYSINLWNNITRAIILPDGLTAIESNAINCSGYGRIVIPASVSKICNNAFMNCATVCEVFIDDDNKYFTFEDGVLYSKDKKTLIQTFALEDSAAFAVPETVTTILGGAFANQHTLQEIMIPASVTTIADDVFNGCVNLAKITVAEDNTAYDSFDTYVLSEDGSRLCFVTITATELFVPATVEEINLITLQHATSVAEITVEEGNDAFCVIDGILYDSDITTVIFCADKSEITEYGIQESVKKIESNAFAGCSNIEYIGFPGALKEIGVSAFANCSSLTRVWMPNTVTSVGWGAFSNCTSLEEITLSAGLTEIVGGMFMYCSSLSNIVIPEGVQTIGNMAFTGCGNPFEIELPASVTYIDPMAFENWGVAQQITVHAPEGSYAAQWALELGYEVVTAN